MLGATMVGVALGAWLTVAPVLRWHAPPECPNADAFRRRVEQRLADAGSQGSVDLELEVTVVRETHAYVVRVSSIAAGERSERVVVGATCEEVTEAAVLITALTLDPQLASTLTAPPAPPVVPAPAAPPIPDPPRSAEPSGVAGSEVTPGPSPAVPASPVPAPPPDGPAPSPSDPEPSPSDPEPSPSDPEPSPSGPAPSPSGPSPSVSPTESRDEPSPASMRSPVARRRGPALGPVGAAELGVALGALSVPRPMPLARLAVGIERGRLRWLGRVSAFGPSVGSLGRGRPGSLAGLGALGTVLCVQTLGPWRVVGCATTDVGLVGARGRNTRDTGSQRGVSWALGGEISLERTLRPALALALRAHASGYPATPTFVLEGQPTGTDEVCCAAWSAGLALGIVGRWARAR